MVHAFRKVDAFIKKIRRIYSFFIKELLLFNLFDIRFEATFMTILHCRPLWKQMLKIIIVCNVIFFI